MLRSTLFLCFLLALYGCGDSSKPASNASREVPEAVKPEGVATAKPDADTKETGEAAEDTAEMAEGNNEAKAGEAAEDAPADETAVADKKKPAADGDDEKDDEKDAGTTTEAAFLAAQKAAQKGDFKGAIVALEKGLESNPDDVNLLISLAQLNLNVAMSEPAKPDYPMYIKAADYIRKALKADPKLSENPRFGSFAGTVYYNEACAWPSRKKPTRP